MLEILKDVLEVSFLDRFRLWDFRLLLRAFGLNYSFLALEWTSVFLVRQAGLIGRVHFEADYFGVCSGEVAVWSPARV